MQPSPPTSHHSFSSVLVLDSSAIASIFFKAKLELQVMRTLQKFDEFSTLDVAYSEIGRVAWKAVVIFKETVGPTYEALKQAVNFILDNCDIVSSKEILTQAFELGAKQCANLRLFIPEFDYAATD